MVKKNMLSHTRGIIKTRMCVTKKRGKKSPAYKQQGSKRCLESRSRKKRGLFRNRE